MRTLRQHHVAAGLVLLAALGMGTSAFAQRRPLDVEPRPFTMRFNGGSVGFYVEGVREETSYNSGLSYTVERIFYGPSIALGAEGSVYHPNLFQFTLAGDFAAGQSDETTTTTFGKSLERSGFDYIGDANFNATILAYKPYRSHLYASTGHAFREYDFFNRVRVNTVRYGASGGYSRGPVPFTVSLARREEQIDGYGYRSGLAETLFNIDARNERDWGSSSFAYAFNDFTRTSDSARDVSGLQHSVGLSDRENFGTGDRIDWRNNASYTVHELRDSPRDGTPSDALAANSALTFQHRPNLSSFYEGHYLRDEADAVVSENYDGGMGARHQLYQSLHSSVRLQALNFSSKRPGGDFESRQYSGSWSEYYTKKLGETARLSLGGGYGRSHTDQDSTTVVPVRGEAHKFNEGGPLVDSFALRLFNVVGTTVEVFDQGRTIRYVKDRDYTLTLLGGRTVLQLMVANPVGLTRDTALVVDYEASAQGSGTIDGEYTDAQIRLDLFSGMLGLYARYNDQEHTGSRGIIVEDVTTTTFGTDFHYRWFRAGAEYQIYEATFSTYDAVRLYQSFAITGDDQSSFSVTFSEGMTEYENARGREEYYSMISRYHQQFTRRLGFDLDAGFSQRFGTVGEQTLAAVRPTLNYNIGQLSVRMGYEFEYRESQSSEERFRHMLTFRARRSF
jgi:hypothetical protein